jgi:hypothetical protein
MAGRQSTGQCAPLNTSAPVVKAAVIAGLRRQSPRVVLAERVARFCRSDDTVMAATVARVKRLRIREFPYSAVQEF